MPIKVDNVKVEAIQLVDGKLEIHAVNEPRDNPLAAKKKTKTRRSKTTAKPAKKTKREVQDSQVQVPQASQPAPASQVDAAGEPRPAAYKTNTKCYWPTVEWATVEVEGGKLFVQREIEK
jgi:hypothetical protein